MTLQNEQTNKKIDVFSDPVLVHVEENYDIGIEIDRKKYVVTYFREAIDIKKNKSIFSRKTKTIEFSPSILILAIVEKDTEKRIDFSDEIESAIRRLSTASSSGRNGCARASRRYARSKGSFSAHARRSRNHLGRWLLNR